MVEKEFTAGKEFTVQKKKSKQSLLHLVCASQGAELSAYIKELTAGQEFRVRQE